MGEMRIMDPEKGDIRENWDSNKPEEVQHARETYEKLTKKNYVAFRVKKNGEKGEKMSKFDPDAELVIFAPMLAGG